MGNRWYISKEVLKMVGAIMQNPKIVDVFPELKEMFEVEKPSGTCAPCVKKEYNTKLKVVYTRLILDGVLKEEDIKLYLQGDYAQVKITPKGIVNFTNSLLRRTHAHIKREEVMVDEITYLERLKTCRNCEFIDKGICSLCTCPIHEKCKRYTDSCPKDFWKE